MNQYIQINLNDMIEELGEERTKNILSSYSCPVNFDVENFLKNKSIEFSKRGFAKTYLVFWQSEDQTEKHLIGYFTLASKVLSVNKDSVSKNVSKKLGQYGCLNKSSNSYEVSSVLIGQLGKNFDEGNDSLISGDELLQMAIDKVVLAHSVVGGRYTYLECEEKPKLIDFYKRNGFVVFGKRKLDRDETEFDGCYLIQLMRYVT